ncbi:hypothetical protein YC2023_101348 [Brassica napus]
MEQVMERARLTAMEQARRLVFHLLHFSSVCIIIYVYTIRMSTTVMNDMHHLLITNELWDFQMSCIDMISDFGASNGSMQIFFYTASKSFPGHTGHATTRVNACKSRNK